ncbi:hypothetical protein [Maritimibacter sp. DP1N21-5]|uniref:hypothetical protein n=1 Tax=Maritimibacter sp. DP1N21-5 TaxID=2836867 RepID=UPI001C47DFBF|nr:hypothetical protein [Maritimibacter sp. DP1N21-5]MBV7409630.1 hypothetical protein [Maritimibacter sp. DP1N21-5]
MRQPAPSIPYSNARPVEYDHSDDGDITYVDGKAYRRETSRHDLDNTITPDEQKVLHLRRLEEAEFRQAHNDANLAAALRLGEALRVLKGED